MKALSIVLVALFLVMPLSGCGSESPAPSSAPQAAPKAAEKAPKKVLTKEERKAILDAAKAEKRELTKTERAAIRESEALEAQAEFEEMVARETKGYE